MDEVPTPDPRLAGFVRAGDRSALDALLAEYGLVEADVAESIRVEPSDFPPNPAWWVHQSLLQSHEPFLAAGDSRSCEYFWKIVGEMRRLFGITADEAIARLNHQWSPPRVWILEGDIVYHELPTYWAVRICDAGSATWRGSEPVDLQLTLWPPPERG